MGVMEKMQWIAKGSLIAVLSHFSIAPIAVSYCSYTVIFFLKTPQNKVNF